MASEQMARRENTTTQREIHVEKDRVPKMTTHFEHLAEQVKEPPPQGSIEALQGGEYGKEHAGKAIGDVGGRGKARETHELGTHFESLADKVKGEDRKEKESDHAMNKGGVQKGVEATREREGHGGVREVGKFEMKTEGKSLGEEALERGDRNREELEKRTRVVTGTPQSKQKRGELCRGEVVAEKGRVKEEEKSRDEEKFKGRVGAERERGREEEKAREENERSTLEGISKYREQAQKNAKEAISAAQERYERAKQATNETLSSTTQTAQEKSAQAKDIAMEKASQAKETLRSTTQTAQEKSAQARDIAMEKASQAKDATIEKGQQGYAATKDTISSAAKAAADYTAPVAEKAKGYTVQAAEKAKSASGTTAQYVGEKAVQAKDVTVETGKTAAGYAGKVAVDLKDKATVAGWTAAHYSAEKTVEGTKAAANVVEGAAGYAGHKAAVLASKTVDAVKGLAASAGETAKEYTARKKKESQRELEAKRAAQYQEGEERPSEGIGETVSQYAQNMKPGQTQGSDQEGMGSNVLTAIRETVGNVGEKVKKPFANITGGGKRESGNDQSEGQVQGKGNDAMTNIADAAERMKKPLGNITKGGNEVLGAVGETVGEIGKNMIKSAEKVQEHGKEGQGGGVLDAIGETIVEIAQTTKIIVAGEGERESKQRVGSESRSTTDRGKHEGQAPQGV